MWGLFYASSLWVLGILIILYHRAGIQLLGTMIASIGLLALLLNTRFFLSLSLLALGLILHSCGRLILYMKRR